MKRTCAHYLKGFENHCENQLFQWLDGSVLKVSENMRLLCFWFVGLGLDEKVWSSFFIISDEQHGFYFRKTDCFTKWHENYWEHQLLKGFGGSGAVLKISGNWLLFCVSSLLDVAWVSKLVSQWFAKLLMHTLVLLKGNNSSSKGVQHHWGKICCSRVCKVSEKSL